MVRRSGEIVPAMTSTRGIAEQPLVRAREPAEQRECCVDIDTPVLGDDAFGLFDHDSRRERTFELGRQRAGVMDGALLEYRDGGDVGHGLRQPDIVVAERARGCGEQVQRSDGVATQLHGHGRHRDEAGPLCFRCELWPLFARVVG